MRANRAQPPDGLPPREPQGRRRRVVAAHRQEEEVERPPRLDHASRRARSCEKMLERVQAPPRGAGRAHLRLVPSPRLRLAPPRRCPHPRVHEVQVVRLCQLQGPATDADAQHGSALPRAGRSVPSAVPAVRAYGRPRHRHRLPRRQLRVPLASRGPARRRVVGAARHRCRRPAVPPASRLRPG